MYYIWWLDQSQTESVTDEQLETLPQYLRDEFASRYGRAGRGRLWVPDFVGDFSVTPWPSTPLADELAKDSGGIVFKAEDLPVVGKLPGVVTDDKLNVIGAVTEPPAPATT